MRPPSLATAALAMLVACAIGGCQTIDTYFPTLRTYGVYMLDINQGNYLSQDMVDKLKVGQTKAQVRQQLGTPLVVSLFRDSRWDYVYEFTRQGVVREHRTFTVYFVDDKLARWEGDEMPKSVADLNKAAAERTLGKMPQTDDPGILGRIVDAFANANAGRATEALAGVTPDRSTSRDVDSGGKRACAIGEHRFDQRLAHPPARAGDGNPHGGGHTIPPIGAARRSPRGGRAPSLANSDGPAALIS